LQSAICTHRSIHEQALQLLKASSSVAAADEAAEVASLSLRLPGRVSSAHTPSVRPPRHARPAASGRQLGRTTPTQLLAIDHAFTSGPPSRTKLHAARRPRAGMDAPLIPASSTSARLFTGFNHARGRVPSAVYTEPWAAVWQRNPPVL